ncbi:HNH endonuclease signature motif containing protein, partial [Ilumatobacter sp.]|uniref:HNH endonuclease signature motif containing protein n=1 Tax=Ilumatobacter sp. TaxID=1967498 RepID=UPI003751A491
ASVVAPANGKRPQPLVNIVIDPTTSLEVLAKYGLIDLTDNDLTDNDLTDNDLTDNDLAKVDPTSRRCATSTGVAVHPDVALQAMFAGSVRRVMVDAHDVVINMGRTQRLFTGKARQAAQLLAVRCGFRGCDVSAEFCDVDHVEPWVDGGETDQANSMPLCGSHDRRKHSEQLRGRRDRYGRIHLIRPDGSVIKPLNAHDPEWADADPERAADDADVGQACPTTIDAAGRTRYRMPTTAELGWSVLHIDLAA